MTLCESDFMNDIKAPEIIKYDWKLSEMNKNMHLCIFSTYKLGLGNRFEIQNWLIGRSIDSIIDAKSVFFS